MKFVGHKKYSSLLFIYLFIVSSAFANKQTKLTDPNIKANQWINQNKQLGFQENKGQMVDTDGKPANYVLFKAEATGINIWVTTSGLTYQFLKFEEKKEESRAKIQEQREICQKDEDMKVSWHRVDMILKKANIKKENIVTEGDITQGKIDYYLGHCPDGIFNIKTFSKITVKNIYDGIDWVLYTNNNLSGNSLKQDFIVHPNANPNQIKLIYEGSGKFDVTNNQIQFENEIGKLQEGKLFCYQGEQMNQIKSNYLVKKNENITNLGAGNFITSQPETLNLKTKTFSFEVAIQLNSYDKSKELTIDPQLVWATFYGGNGYDWMYDIVADKNNDVIIVGTTASSNFPVLAFLSAYFSASNTGQQDAYVLKFNSNGILLWSTYYGGNIYDVATTVCVDPYNNLYVSGGTNSFNFPLLNIGGASFFQATNATTSPPAAGETDVFILKFDQTGNCLLATYYGGANHDVAYDICADLAGNIFIIGKTSSINFPTLNTGTFFQGTLSSIYSNGFIIKFDNNGVLLWSTYFSGLIIGVVCDLTGNIFITGGAGATATVPLLNPGSGSYFQSTIPPSSSGIAFISKFNNTGVLLWSTYFGGTVGEAPISLRTDNTGNVFIIGTTWSPNMPTLNPGGGALFQPAKSGLADVFLLKFSNNGILLWSTYFGGSFDDNSQAGTYKQMDVDECNNVFIAFQTQSPDLPVLNACTNGYMDASFNSNWDIYILKISNSCTMLWGSYFGGDGYESGASLAINKEDIFLVGTFTPLNTLTYPSMNPAGAYNSNFAGGIADGFISKFTSPSLNTSVIVAPSDCNCKGTATCTAIGGCAPYVYTWYDASWTTIGNTQSNINLCPGNYQIVVTDTINCSKKDTTTITITNTGILPNVTLLSTANIPCSTGSGVINANSTTPGVSYSWNGPGIVSGGNSNSPTINATGTYTVTVTDPITNCTNTAIITVSYSIPNFTNITTTSIACNPNTGTITANSSILGITYSWAGPGIVSGGITNSPIVNAAGTYTVIITDPLTGCTNSNTIVVSDAPLPTAGISPNVTIPFGSNTTLTATGGSIYKWLSPNTGLNIITGNAVIASPTATSTYCVEVTDINNCKDTACVTVTVETPCFTYIDLIVPNAFSPNADNVNDEFCLQGWNNCIEKFSVKIFDRWGEQVFISNNPDFCWNGIYNNQLMEPQVFVYYIEAKFTNQDGTTIKKGNISLIR